MLTEADLDLAEVEAARGFLLEAATRAFHDASERGFAEYVIRARVVLAGIHNRAGLHEEALAQAREADRQAAAAGTGLHRLDGLREAAVALAALGRIEEAKAGREALEAVAEALADAAAERR